MAENKKSFIAYCSWKDTFDVLPDDKAGQLVKHLFAYVNDENPKTDDILINAVFANIKNQLKTDLRKYEEIREKNKENARKRWNKENATASDRINYNANHADNDNDNVNDIKRKNIEKEKFNFKSELLDLGVEDKIVSDWLEVRRKKKAANTETAFSRLKTEIEKSGLPANECIKIAAESSWQGFKSEWITKNGKTKQPEQNDSKEYWESRFAANTHS